MKKPWTLRKRVFLSSVAITGIVTLLLGLFNVMELYVTDRNTTAFETYMNLSTFFDSIDEAGGYLEEYLYTENDDSLNDYDAAIQTAEQSISGFDPNFLEDQMWRFQLLSNMLSSYEDLCAELIADPLNDDLYTQTVNAQDLIQSTSGDYYQRLTNRMEHHVEQLQSVNQAIVVGSLVVIAILLFWIIYVAFIMLRSFIRPLYEVLDNIERINEGTYDFNAVAANGIEMQTLCESLEAMADTVHKEIQETKEKAQLKQLLLEKENESLHKDELLARSEFRMLQNQVNPHFLFNTLNMIHRLCVCEENEKAAETVLKTSQLLRYSLDNQNQYSSIRKELEAIRSYIDIQKLRFGERIRFLILNEHVDACLDMSFPGMILQPLVENAVRHGLKNVTHDGEVEIYLGADEESLTISVSDNGEGMPKEDAEALLQRCAKAEESTQLGLFNVVQRLKMFFKDRADIRIDSDKDCGFSFAVVIALEGGGQDDTCADRGR